jgi:hypothetical protein
MLDLIRGRKMLLYKGNAPLSQAAFPASMYGILSDIGVS